jgi:hypothetical protein
MGTFSKSIIKVAKGAMDAFGTFPAAIASALAFSIVTAIRIHLDWPQQEEFNFLFNCLHWAFGFGALFGIAAVTYVRTRKNSVKDFTLANLFTAAVITVIFLLLYFFGGREPLPDDYFRFMRLADISIARMTALSFAVAVAFVIFAGLPRKNPNMTRSIFMTQKAFITAAIYGGVMMGGTSAVAGAIQALLYNDMSYKVYQYLGTIVGFLTFTIFAGYFPDFSKAEEDEKRKSAQSQSRFMEVLFSYIMVPIALALTVVLLLWTVRTVMEGIGSSFVRLSSIATSYAVGGIWLHIMVAEHNNGLAKFYRRVYPVAALLILGFEAWALIVQLGRFGMKTTEYFFLITWVVAVVSVLLIILQKERAYIKISILTALAALIAVLPLAGYHTLPARLQSQRLEKLLISANMLQAGAIVPGSESLDKELREQITDSVSFLAYQYDAELPDWFDRDLANYRDFKDTFGFEQAWPQYDEYIPPSEYVSTFLTLEPVAIDVSGYDWAFNLLDFSKKGEGAAELSGRNGTYLVEWILDETNSTAPRLRISLDDKIILDEVMQSYVDRISEKYPPAAYQPRTVGLEDMSERFDSENIEVLVVFNTSEINLDAKNDRITYWLSLNSIYLKEK